MNKKPEILSAKEVAKTRIFRVEELQLKFANGEHRTYERLKAGGSGAVLIVAINEKNELLLIREYSAGIDAYELALPKGLIDNNEAALDAANRELKEEVGFGARDLVELTKVTFAPGYLSHKMSIVLARDLYVEKLEGDEPEPIEVVPMPFDDIDAIIARDDFTEARSIAALYLARHFLSQQ